MLLGLLGCSRVCVRRQFGISSSDVVVTAQPVAASIFAAMRELDPGRRRADWHGSCHVWFHLRSGHSARNGGLFQPNIAWRVSASRGTDSSSRSTQPWLSLAREGMPISITARMPSECGRFWPWKGARAMRRGDQCVLTSTRRLHPPQHILRTRPVICKRTHPRRHPACHPRCHPPCYPTTLAVSLLPGD